MTHPIINPYYSGYTFLTLQADRRNVVQETQCPQCKHVHRIYQRALTRTHLFFLIELINYWWVTRTAVKAREINGRVNNKFDVMCTNYSLLVEYHLMAEKESGKYLPTKRAIDILAFTEVYKVPRYSYGNDVFSEEQISITEIMNGETYVLSWQK